MRIRHANCMMWDCPLSNGTMANIRLALQEEKLFFDLDDILMNVCHMNLTRRKQIMMVKNLKEVGKSGLFGLQRRR